MNSIQLLIGFVFGCLAILLLVSAMRHPTGSPGRKAQLRVAFIFGAVGIVNGFWYLISR